MLEIFSKNFFLGGEIFFLKEKIKEYVKRNGILKIK
jgi:hypothetical protein